MPEDRNFSVLKNYNIYGNNFIRRLMFYNAETAFRYLKVSLTPFGCGKENLCLAPERYCLDIMQYRCVGEVAAVARLLLVYYRTYGDGGVTAQIWHKWRAFHVN
jgi:hypothetical protein